ncbi:MAG: hypothetical protein Q7W55_07710 [Pseudohongiella sp.]|nr:hypothetical protein [Pseudohongiella sp.]MDO9521363.1 hypothetical protein [Pseudohongiella sp.]MDP2125869.1 hypothetical protein [Pseudohongiella sp.]
MDNKVKTGKSEQSTSRQYDHISSRDHDLDMYMPRKLELKDFYRQDWRIQFGLVVTLLWLLAGTLYIAGTVGWRDFTVLPIDQMGNFLEGAFAPLAFLWLVIGLFIQQTILAQNNRELYHSNIVSSRQAEALSANERNARQETFFKIADNTRRQLGGITGLLLLSSKGAQGDGTISETEFAEMWHQFATGDFEIFSRRFLILAGRGEELLPLFYGTQIRTTHTENFIVNFDRLLKLARDCDINGIITDAQLHSAHGLLSSRMRELHPRIKFRRYEMTRNSTYLDQIMKDSLE